MCVGRNFDDLKADRFAACDIGTSDAIEAFIEEKLNAGSLGLGDKFGESSRLGKLGLSLDGGGKRSGIGDQMVNVVLAGGPGLDQFPPSLVIAWIISDVDSRKSHGCSPFAGARLSCRVVALSIAEKLANGCHADSPLGAFDAR